jgi:hypothetical protein
MSIPTLSKQDTKKIAKLKCLALKLCEKKQITRKLCRLILEVDTKDVTYVTNLMALTEDLLRVEGYYRNEARITACDNAINEWLGVSVSRG